MAKKDMSVTEKTNRALGAIKAAQTRKENKLKAERVKLCESRLTVDYDRAYNPFTQKVYFGANRKILDKVFNERYKKNPDACNFWLTPNQCKLFCLSFKGLRGKGVKLYSADGAHHYTVFNVCDLRDVEGYKVTFKHFSERELVIKNLDTYYHDRIRTRAEKLKDKIIEANGGIDPEQQEVTQAKKASKRRSLLDDLIIVDASAENLNTAGQGQVIEVNSDTYDFERDCWKIDPHQQVFK